MKLLLAFYVMAFAIDANARNKTCDFPQTTFRFEVGTHSGISHKSMLAQADKIKAVYGPIAKKHGATLAFNDLWADPTVNSDTYRQGKYWYVDAYGGLARFPGMTADAMLEVFCHEIEHQVGGQPTYNHGTDWAAVEGQADWMATKECMKAMGVDSTQPSLVLAKILARLGGEPAPWRPGPKLPAVSETFEDHPASQCRLDTYDAGRLGGSRPLCWFHP
jgi:hypothetical protein